MEKIGKMENQLYILSLEDSTADFELICEKVESAGYKLDITRVDTEADFTQLVRSNRYDIILADFNLPSFDAFKALTICNEYCPEIPFICVSGSIGEIMAIELLKQGAVDYVLKDRIERLPFAIKRALAQAKEIAENERIRKSLEQSEEKYRTIFENVQDVFYQTNIAGTILEISPSIHFFSDYYREDLIGKSVTVLYANSRDRSGLLKKIRRKGEISDFEVQLKTRTGQIKYASINAKLIYNPIGEPDHIDGAIRDITARKLAEEATRESEAELNKAQEIGKMGSWIFNVQNFQYKWSRNMLQMLGFSLGKKDITYEQFLDKVHPEDLYLFDWALQQLRDTKQEVRFNFRYIRADGEIMWFQDNIMPVFRNGTLIELHGVNLDITEQKRVEQELIKAKENAEASDRLKTSFLNNISHEIRTPLNGILGFGQILANENLTQAEKEEYLNILNVSGERLINTVTSFIDISMISSHNQEVKKESVNIESLVKSVTKSFRDLCASKDLELLILLPEAEYNQRIFTDEVLLSKILHHLIDNAVKFTSSGSIVIGCVKLNNEFLFSVKDTGVGISEEHQKNIFKNFAQEEISNSRGYEGCGLGLSIASGLIELLEGSIWMESEKGKGSTFYFTIPDKQS